MSNADREEFRLALERAVERIRTARRDGKPAGFAAFEVWGARLRKEGAVAGDLAQLVALALDREAAAGFLRDGAQHAPDPAPVLAAADLFAQMAARARAAPATPELADELFDLEAAAAERLETALTAW